MWGGSVERSCGPMNKNRIEGVADQGERARNREALVIKGKRRRSGGRAVKECVLTWGDLALGPKGHGVEPEREVSRGRSSRWEGCKADPEAKGRTRGSVPTPCRGGKHRVRRLRKQGGSRKDAVKPRGPRAATKRAARGMNRGARGQGC